ncbi:cyclic nucleotide-binding domain-containing protein [Limimaricola sp.]|uniref:Crp/Fnr family transcriptional regulator n=1 Tax=Limimaricola sp. TaxID=2211665 RepID=UPI0025C66B50|nr:cyclic nucleotide-binding domain-containing protein [Limimaricola sp.]
MHWSEIAGYVASALVFITFSMKTIVPLRMVAIFSNVAFIVYAAGAGLVPILVLHATLLPLNVFRTWQHVETFRRIRRAAEGRADVDVLVPFMTRRAVPGGTQLFHKGDRAEHLYLLSKGRILLTEIGKELQAGALFGEVGMFADDGLRTTSAVCVDDCELLVIDRDRIIELYHRDSAFGYYLTRLIANRMGDNIEQMAGGRGP